MDYGDQEEDTDYYLGGLRQDLRINVYLQEEEIWKNTTRTTKSSTLTLT